MSDKEAAKIFVDAIRTIAGKERNLENLESYLGEHFSKWILKYTFTPEDMATEMKYFVQMEI